VDEVVLDASVWVACVVAKDPHYERSRRWLDRHVAEGRAIVAPALILPEVSGPVARRTQSRTLGLRAATVLRRLPGLRLVALDRRLAEAAEALAATLRLRGADAVYVAVAQELNLPLVTWDDEQLERAARVVSVRTATIA
jgi:predicted nucleic acid-binding protein